jgi:ankyrin repeat protein
LYRPLAYDNIDLIWYLFSQLEGEMLVKAKEIALSYAASGGCLEATKLLLEEKVNPNCINTRDETPLECAIHAWRNAEETINLLLDNGADINRVSNNGWSVLMSSLCNGITTNLSICRLLLERGADYTYVNKEGRSAYTVSRMWKFIADFYDNTIKELTNKNNSQLSL